ncbi:MAG: SAM-dependent methyltransferase [Limnobacter sp.]|uniref:SAM-dependent methyltransferase n=1 Tax=Limnobacter sp. TaxID=2003368 RepID=UPI00391B802D
MLILVPTPLSQTTPKLPVLSADLPLLRDCSTWVVENAKPARAALGMLNLARPTRDLTILELDKLDRPERIKLIQRAAAGEPIGLMSDAGCPAVADPGASLVRLAHEHACPVRPLVGPSSIMLALMGSGLEGQRFQFHGYPPLDATERQRWISTTESASKSQACTQLCIETPFRNDKWIEALLTHLKPTTRVCVGWDLTGDAEHLTTKTVADWRKNPPKPGKQPCIFAWLA